MRGATSHTAAATSPSRNRTYQHRRTRQINPQRRRHRSNTPFRRADVEVGVFLNGRKPGDQDAQGNPLPPDLIRRLDILPDDQHQGLLQQISEEDLKETDFYIYRVSNGQKIQERKGLNDINLYKDGSSGLYYLSLIRWIAYLPPAAAKSKKRSASSWRTTTTSKGLTEPITSARTIRSLQSMQKRKKKLKMPEEFPEGGPYPQRLLALLQEF